MVKGYDQNNVFFGGGHVSNKNPVLKKWENGSITTYPILNDSGISIHDILTFGANQAWVTTVGSNNIYKFNTGQYIKYVLDDSIKNAKFFKNASGDLFVFGVYTERNINNTISEVLYSYKFENDSFVLVSKDSIYPATPKTDYLMNCGTDMFMISSPDQFNQIYLFNGNKWEYYITAPEYNISNIGGISKNYFVTFFASRLSIYMWNGNWRKEDSLKFPNYPPFFSIGSSSIIINNRNVYFTAKSVSDNVSFLIIGKIKQ